MAIINLFGASGHAKVIIDIIKAQGDSTEYLYDDTPHCKEISGIPVLGASLNHPQGKLIISVGNNSLRKEISERYDNCFTTAIHPSAIISSSAVIGDGSVLMPGAIIQAEVHIGRHCIINTGATIDHECQIGDYVHIAPGATLCGNVTVGEGTLIGVGSKVIPGVKIGKWCIIGAGSVVIRDIPDGMVAFGNPCKFKQ